LHAAQREAGPAQERGAISPKGENRQVPSSKRLFQGASTGERRAFPKSEGYTSRENNEQEKTVLDRPKRKKTVILKGYTKGSSSLPIIEEKNKRRVKARENEEYPFLNKSLSVPDQEEKKSLRREGKRVNKIGCERPRKEKKLSREILEKKRGWYPAPG